MFRINDILTINDDGVGVEVQWLTKDGRPLPATSDEYIHVEDFMDYETIIS